MHESYPVAFSPDRRIVITAGSQCPMYSWDLESGKRLLRFTDADALISSLTFSPDGKTIAAICHETIGEDAWRRSAARFGCGTQSQPGFNVKSIWL